MQNINYRKKLEQVLEILERGQELNMGNYNHDEVRALNDTFIEAYLFVDSALAENTPTSQEQLATPAVIKSVCENCSNADFNETMGCKNYFQGFKCENFKQTIVVN